MHRLVSMIGSAFILAGCAVASSSLSPSAGSTAPTIAAPSAASSAGPTSTSRPTPTPVSGAGKCPTDSPLSVAQFTDADPRCFGGADVEIRGWLDSPPDTGVEPPFVDPAWLAYSTPMMTSLWEIPPVGPNHFCPNQNGACPWFFLHIDPASGLTLDFPPRWLIVTGHTQDPAAETCHFVYGEEWTEPRLDDALAVESCRTKLVIVSFRDAP
jgi:hypothetical protein